jgi:hypothetical protein
VERIEHKGSRGDWEVMDLFCMVLDGGHNCTFVKNHRTPHHKVWTLVDRYQLKTKVNQDARKPQDGMQAMTNEWNYIKIVDPPHLQGIRSKLLSGCLKLKIALSPYRLFPHAYL